MRDCKTRRRGSSSIWLALWCGLFPTATLWAAPQMGGLDDLAPAGEATHVAIRDGAWTDPGTWSPGVPPDGARVRIPGNRTVLMDAVDTGRVEWIRLEGTLRTAPDRDTRLRVGTLAGLMGSRLEVGTAAAGIDAAHEARITFLDLGAIDRDRDPQELGRGLVTMGQVEMRGVPRSAFHAAAGPVRAGDAGILLETTPVGWRAGDRIAITGTAPGDPTSDEVRTIAAISGREIAFKPALARDHLAPSPDLRVHVANLSRNITVDSESAAIGRRGHVMFMHTHDVDCRHVRFHRLGRTDKRRPLDDWTFPNLDAELAEPGPGTNRRGRYSVHFHRGGVDPSTPGAGRIEGCVVEDDPGWAYVNHSSNVDFVGNVSYDVVGGAFQTESGDEIGSFVGNIAIRTVNPDRPILDPATEPVDIREDSQDFAFQGDAFWLHGGGVAVDDNVASGCSGHGFIYWTEGLREVGTPFDYQNMFLPQNVPNGELLGNLEVLGSWFVPLRSFRGNTAYSAAKGLALYYVHTTQFDDITSLTDAYVATMESTLKDTTLWNVDLLGVEIQNSERFTFDGLRLENAAAPDLIGILPWPTVAGRTVWNDLVVRGFGRGMVAPMQGDVTIRGGEFANAVDFSLIPPQKDSNEPASDRDLLIAEVAFPPTGLVPPAERVNFEMLAGAALRGELPLLNPEDAHLLALIPDRIVADVDGLGRRRLYYEEQAPGFVPVDDENIWDASGRYRTDILDRSNAALRDRIGLSFAGALLPADAISNPRISGGLAGPVLGESMPSPSCLFINAAPLPPDFFDDFDFYDCWDSSPPVEMSIPPFDHPSPPSDCPADLNDDRSVDGGDLGLMIAAWGTDAGDLNGDGLTNGADLGLLLNAWGECG